MKKIILGIGLAIGLSACCDANAAVFDEPIYGNPTIEFWGGGGATFEGRVLQTNYDAAALGITNNGSLEYEYINSVFGTSFTGLGDLVYKAEKNNDFGQFANDYETGVFNTSSFRTNHNSIWNGEWDAIECDYGCYMAVKDGQAALDRPYLFFNISSWNGIDTLAGNGMWDMIEDYNDGWKSYADISHVSIWANSPPVQDEKPAGNVPEPMPLMLMGIGLVGMALNRKRA